ncbi:hypothetical protein M407DRAFT_82133, partial [Tulasnella calospora MUT 4182]
ERVFLATLCWGALVCGWNDGTLGPLLPRIQANYHVGYAVVSMLFVCSTIVLVLSTVIHSRPVSALYSHLHCINHIAASIQISVYAILAPAPPFPVMCVVFVMLGFSMALQAAFVACIPRNASSNMGILHAFYGLGAFAAPLVSTQFSQQKRWSFHYLISMGIALTSLVITIGVFRLKRQEDLIPSESSSERSEVATRSTYKHIFTQKFVITLAAFILIYVGIEVSIGGWIVTFLINRRGGGPSTGYVSSGFFGGMMLGRVLLLPVNQKVGKQRVIYIYSALVIALQFTVWFVPSLIENAIAVSFVGLFLGPIYPVSINVAAEILPAWLLVGAIGFIGAFGQAGSAVFPFMTGAIASKYGVQVLQPMYVPFRVPGLNTCSNNPLAWWC